MAFPCRAHDCPLIVVFRSSFSPTNPPNPHNTPPQKKKKPSKLDHPDKKFLDLGENNYNFPHNPFGEGIFARVSICSLHIFGKCFSLKRILSNFRFQHVFQHLLKHIQEENGPFVLFLVSWIAVLSLSPFVLVKNQLCKHLTFFI